MTRELTREQRRAVETVAGDVAISAGAGSGKTTVLAHRFARALTSSAEQGWEPAEVDRILTITFTNKAAAEIAERVRRVVGTELSPEAGRRVIEAWISTIHTFCGRLVRRHVLEAGVEPHFSQADEVAIRLLKAEAFERAAREFYGNHAGATRLMDLVEFGSLHSTVVSIHDNVRAMGLDPRDVRVPHGIDELEALKAAVVRAAEELRRVLGECKPTDAVSRNAARLDEWCAQLTACTLGDDGACERLVAVGDDYDVKGLRNDARVANDELKAAIAQLRAAALAAGEPELLEGYRALVVAFTRAYATLKAERAILDFDDLQERAAELLKTHPHIARRYREHFRMLMIDEFQDTNELQLRVVGPLRDDNLCVVGDERQSIYGFRYADVEVFERLRERIPARVELADNFRSHPDVLAFVNATFSQEHLFGPQFMQLSAGRTAEPDAVFSAVGRRVECCFVDNPDKAKSLAVAEEARFVATRVRELLDAGVRGGEIAVLLRNATNAGAFASALETLSVPTLVTAGVALLDTPEAREVTALMRTIAVPADDERLAEVLASRLVSLSDDGLLALRLAAGRNPMWSAVRAVGEGSGEAAALSAYDFDAVRFAYRAIDELGAQQGRLSLHELIHAACEAFDYDLTLFSAGPSGLRAWNNVLKIARFARHYEQVESSDPASFVEYLKQRSDGTTDRPAAESGGDAVRIMTIHAAKGLEFEVVFAADLGAAKYRGPSAALVAKSGEGDVVVPALGIRLKLDDDAVAQTELHQRLAAENKRRELAEQQRCLYVACTRARELLVVSGVSDLSKPAEESPAIIGWVRQALGDPSASGPVTLGDAVVEVRCIAPADEVEAPPATRTIEPGPLFVEFNGTPPVTAPRTAPPTTSYSALHVHEQCTLSYHARYELRLGEYRGPAEKRASDFGSAFHAVMQASRGGDPPPASVEAAAVRYGLDATERERLARAIAAFQASPLAARLASADRVECEEPVRLYLGATALGGSIDAIAWSGRDVLVLDYKTGRAPSPEAKSRTSGYELQARCYALAAFQAGAERVEAAFCFVEHEAQELRFTFTADEAAAIRADIERRIAAISEAPVTHLDAYDPEVCAWCAARGGICPIDAPAQQSAR